MLKIVLVGLLVMGNRVNGIGVGTDSSVGPCEGIFSSVGENE